MHADDGQVSAGDSASDDRRFAMFAPPFQPVGWGGQHFRLGWYESMLPDGVVMVRMHYQLTGLGVDQGDIRRIAAAGDSHTLANSLPRRAADFGGVVAKIPDGASQLSDRAIALRDGLVGQKNVE